MEAFERFSQRVEQHYREPVNGQFEDGTKEVLPGEEIENSSDENDQDIASEQYKMWFCERFSGNKVILSWL